MNAQPSMTYRLYSNCDESGCLVFLNGSHGWSKPFAVEDFSYLAALQEPVVCWFSVVSHPYLLQAGRERRD